MENSLKIFLLSAAMFAAGQTYAQEHKTVGDKVDRAAKHVGHKTSELASKGAAAVSDKRYEGHWARTGENVYIDEHNKYFYVNKRGHRVFITKLQMRTRPLHR